MNQAATAGQIRWVYAWLASTLLAALAFACVSTQLSPTPGLIEITASSRVPVPGGHVNAAGGNFFHERVDLALDTRLGPFAIGAVYNSAWGWTASVDATYKNGTLRDATGASLPLAALANGAAAPGTHWVKLDATRVKTKGGLVHEFDAATGRLLAIRYASAPYPRIRFGQVQLGAAWRTNTVEQCESATLCTPVFTLAYDSNARLVRIDDRAGRSARFAYDAAGKLTSARDGLDVAKGWPGERYAYSGNYLAAITRSEGERVEIVSDAMGRATEVRAIGAGDPAWRFDYGVGNAAGVYTTRVLDPLGNASTYAIDAVLRTLSMTNALGERTEFSWSGMRPASRTLADGTRTAWTWADDDLATETLPSGNVRTFTYQANGVDRASPFARPLLELRDSLGLVARHAYDADGRLTASANGANETTRVSYDSGEAIASITSLDGTVTHFSDYGEAGLPGSATFGTSTLAAVTSYDRVGNPVRSEIPDTLSGGVTQRSYDADRNVAELEVVDAPVSGTATQQTITQEHRSDGQLLRTTRPYGGESAFSFDALGRLVAIAEQASPGAAAQPGTASVTTIANDLLGRVTAVERANGMREEVAYDAAGRIVRRRTLQSGVLETEVTFEFSAGRLVHGYDAHGFDETIAYDAAGRVSEVRHSNGEATRFAYDSRSRPTRSDFLLPGGAPLATLAHGYDLADRETSLAYLGVNLVSRSFVLGRLERTHYGNGVRQDHFRGTQAGRTTGRELWRGSTRLEKSDYAIAARPGGEITQLRSEVTSGTAADGVTQEDYAYASLGRNAMERRVASAGAERFSYDALSNLTGGVGPTASPLVAYNAEHNRVLNARHPVGTGLLTFILTSTYTYDAAGFATRESISVGPYRVDEVLTWNARGQLSAIRSDGELSANFEYDPLGRRLVRTLAGVTTRWRFGGSVEADANGQPIALDLGEVRIEFAGQHRYRHDDLRGNPKHVTDAAGRVVRHNAYLAYDQTSALGPQSDDIGFARGTPVATPFTRYVLIGARLYSPMLARFLAPDPLWNPVNQYAYTLGNPVDFWDASGLHAGPHYDLQLATLGLAGGLLGLVGGIILFTIAPVGVPTVLAGIALAGAFVNLGRAMVEFQRQKDLHTERTRTGRHGATDDTGGDSGTGVGAGAREFGGGGRSVGRVCSDDGMGVLCTRSVVSGSWTSTPGLFYF